MILYIRAVMVVIANMVVKYFVEIHCIVYYILKAAHWLI